jgi:predicted phosphodiesterase
VVAGNCEEQLAAGAGDCGCGFEEGTECDRLAKSWYEFANNRISSGDRQWMAAELERAGADVVIAGHCGIPFIEKIDARVWFNPGVIGMPAK